MLDLYKLGMLIDRSKDDLISVPSDVESTLKVPYKSCMNNTRV